MPTDSYLVRAFEMIDGIERHPCYINALVYTQMNVNQGMIMYGDRGKQSAMKEVKNLVSRECF